jgi:glutamine synthetase
MKKFIIFFACIITILSLSLNAAKGPIVFENVSDFNKQRLFKAEEYNLKDVLERIREEKIALIQLEFVDIFGNPKSYTITAQQAPNILKKGIAFDGSSIHGFSSVFQSDLLLKPDFATFIVLPWTKEPHKTASIISSITNFDGTPHQCCTRTILKKAQDAAKLQGYEFNVSPELECFIIKKNKKNSKPKAIDSIGYCVCAEHDNLAEFKREALVTLKDMGIKPEKAHPEVAESQHEFTFHYSNALESADNLIRTKNALTLLAKNHGFDISYMPKPFFGKNGSGMHIHYSLFDTKQEKNIFYSNDDEFFLSSDAYSFIAGNLRNIKELTALFNPSINSYKRLVKGYEAPVFICWGPRNRSCAIRIPEISPGEESAARAEIRTPDPLCNPYLAFAVLLYSGLEGLTSPTKLQPEMRSNVFTMDDYEVGILGIDTLPESLEDALKYFRESTFARNVLGDNFVNTYVDLKSREVQDFNIAVTDWELERYL